MWRLNDCPLKPSLWTCSLYLQHALTIQRSYLNADIASYYLHTILSQRRHRFNFDNHAGSQFFSRLETPDREFKYVRDMNSSHSLRNLYCTKRTLWIDQGVILQQSLPSFCWLPESTTRRFCCKLSRLVVRKKIKLTPHLVSYRKKKTKQSESLSCHQHKHFCEDITSAEKAKRIESSCRRTPAWTFLSLLTHAVCSLFSLLFTFC